MSVDGRERLPLTAGQIQHYGIGRRNAELRTAIWSSYRIPGALDVDRLVDSVETLVSRHEALRLQVVEEPGGELYQWVRDPPDRTELVALRQVVSRSEEQFARYVRHVTAAERARDWQPDAFPFRFRLMRYDPEVHALVVGFSHLATDGIGADLLMRDLKRIYAGGARGRVAGGQPPRSFVASAVRHAAVRARRSRPREVPPPAADPPFTRFELPGPGPGPGTGTGAGTGTGRKSRQSVFCVTGDALADLRRLARLHRCTEFQWILAAFVSTVFRFTRQDRLAVGVPVNLRTAAERDVVGMYVISVPVLIDRPAGPWDLPRLPRTVAAALIRAAAAYLTGDQEGEAGPAKAAGPRGTGHGQDLSVNYTKSPFPSRTAAELGWSEYEPQVDYTIRGVALRFFSHPDALRCHAVLDAAAFTDSSAEALVGGFRQGLTVPAARWAEGVPSPAGTAPGAAGREEDLG